MATGVFLRLTKGRRIRFGSALDDINAAKVKADVEHWIAEGRTLTVADAQGGAEDVAADSVVAVELVHEATPPRGTRHPAR
jgi:hypothetical protein